MNISKFTASLRFRYLKQSYTNWIKKDDQVIDIGCGNGIITKLLKENFNIKITGCDIKNYLTYNLPFITIRNNNFSTFKRRFKVAMLNDVLHHISKNEQERLISESLKIANKMLIFEAEPTLFGKIADIILNKFHYGNLNTPLSFRSSSEWQKLFRKLHLSSTLIRLKKPFWYPFSHIAFLVEKK